MADAEDESSSSSLRRKKTPWLRVDIPSALNATEEHNNFLQVDSSLC